MYRAFRSQGLSVVGRTTEGQPVVSFFSLLDSDGIPLELVLEVLQQHEMVPDWTGFYQEAVRAGWHPDRVVHRLEEAVSDVYGPAHRKHWRFMMDAWLKRLP